MSFCIRSISNSSRYIPTFTVTVQGCNTRRSISWQLLKQVNSFSTSNVNNEFLGSNIQNSVDNRDEYKLSRPVKESMNDVQLQPKCTHVEHLLDISNNNRFSLHETNPVQNSRKSYELFPQKINSIDYLNSVGLPRNSPTINKEKSSIGKNNRINITGLNQYTKHNTKVIFSLMTKPNTILEPNNLSSVSKMQNDEDKKSPNERLEHVYNTLSLDLPNFFTKSPDYKIYHPDLEFINNLRGGTVTKGLYNYFKQVVLLRTVGHLKFAFVKFEVIKITMHTSDNTVRVRWRIVGVTGMKVFFSFWKFKVWKTRESLKDQDRWYDGFSTFYIGNDGLIYKHVADKMMPDNSEEEIKPKDAISSKLASQLTFSAIQ